MHELYENQCAREYKSLSVMCIVLASREERNIVAI
jgi:hypothetical protein